MTTITPISFDPSTLLSYYQSLLPSSTNGSSASAIGNTSTSSASSNSATANDDPPWDATTTPSQQARDAQVLNITDFMDTSNVPVLTPTSTDAKTEQDNQKLFSLYNAVNNLAYLAGMAKRSTMTAGQLVGLNTRFQTGLQQVESYLGSTSFNNFTLQATSPSSSVTGTASVPYASFGYTGGTIVSDANVENALPGVSTSDSFTIAVTKGGTTTDVPIDFSQIQGPLTVDNIDNYVNQQLKAAGFATQFQRVFTQGSVDDTSKASYGIQINTAPGESVSLSSDSATSALYVAGTTGLTTSTADATQDNQGNLVKFTNLSDPQAVFNTTVSPTTGTTTAQSTVVDSNGNVYVVGNATGNFGNQLNQGSQDVYLTKYDSAGNLQWTKLLGSAASASAYSLALNPQGGVVVAGSTTADLSPTAVADGNNDSFVSEYDTDGNQLWTTQIQTLNQNQANSVSVDASGNVYVGGQVTGPIAAGQTSNGGQDGYITKLDSNGNVVYEQQLGTSGTDSVAATAVTSSGDLIVASEQNGDAILSKYTGGNATQSPEWTMDLGALQNGGSISGLTVSSDGQIYVAGTTSNANLTANGGATVANASSGGTNAFVFSATDQGNSVTANTVSYVGTDGETQAGGIAVGPDGTVYLTGTTTGTFAGQTRNISGTNNTFVTAMAPDGTIDWTNQYGGADGQSSGQGIAVDPTGSSVLDALGLPRGTIDTDQSDDLANQTTLRAGDSFQIAIQGTAARTFTITVNPGDTLQSLVTEINGELGANGTASVSDGANGESLKISVSKGVTAQLIAGPTDSDALARLGIAPGTLTNSSSSSGSKSSSSSSSTSGKVFGLGLSSDMDISTATDAGAAKAELQNVLSAIQNAYQSTNTPASATSTTGQSGGTLSAAQQVQMQTRLASYDTALNLLSGSNSTTSTTIGASSLFGILASAYSTGISASSLVNVLS
jgi:hypothetical protein